MNKSIAEITAAEWSLSLDEIICIVNNNSHRQYKVVLFNNLLDNDEIVGTFFGGELVYIWKIGINKKK